tara:strand:- start:98 stop:460 length:363 start_codon:yes stop_codon:yes gene_type:complete
LNRLAAFAALIGFLGVAFGAFGAHALDGRLTAEGADWWHTATLYALPHAAAVMAIALSGRTGLLRSGGWFMAVGACIFAGTLYSMALGAPRWFGAITPIGGVSLLVGWALAAISSLRPSN